MTTTTVKIKISTLSKPTILENLVPPLLESVLKVVLLMTPNPCAVLLALNIIQVLSPKFPILKNIPLATVANTPDFHVYNPLYLPPMW